MQKLPLPISPPSSLTTQLLTHQVTAPPTFLFLEYAQVILTPGLLHLLTGLPDCLASSILFFRSQFKSHLLTMHFAKYSQSQSILSVILLTTWNYTAHLLLYALYIHQPLKDTSEKCIIRWLYHCLNIVEYIYTNLDGIACFCNFMCYTFMWLAICLFTPNSPQTLHE